MAWVEQIMISSTGTSNIFKKHFTSQLFRIGRMCRVGQKVHGKKNMLAISFFSPSSENQNWRQGQNPNIAVKPSASERMVPFLVNEIFQFFDATDLGDAAPFIQAYYNKGRYYSKVNSLIPARTARYSRVRLLQGPNRFTFLNMISVMESRR